MAAIVEQMQKQHAAEVETYQQIQKDLQKCHGARTQFQTQMSENTMVLKELDLLEEDANVFKMVGPLLVKQDLVEAKSNVGKRLDYIKGETERLETQFKGLEKRQSEKQKEIVKIQNKLKDVQQAGGKA